MLTATFSGSALMIFESGNRRFIRTVACSCVATSEQTVSVDADALNADKVAANAAASAVFLLIIAVNSCG